ncbi:MAG: CoA-binding protein [Alphaproteobacteria bacterium]
MILPKPDNDDAALTALFDSTQTIALIGASPKPHRASNEVMGFLLAHGFTVYPVNPGQAGKEILGQKVYATLADVPGPVDMVDVFREKAALPALTDQAIAHGTKALWFQLDLVDHKAAAKAQEAGMTVVMDRCPAIEIPRLGWRR